jgi:predicted HTH domain antitoxin
MRGLTGTDCCAVNLREQPRRQKIKISLFTLNKLFFKQIVEILPEYLENFDAVLRRNFQCIEKIALWVCQYKPVRINHLF